MDPQERQEKVYLLMVRGMRKGDIAKELGVTPQTISHDVKKIKEEMNERIKRNPQLTEQKIEHIYKAIDELDDVTREAYKLLNEESGGTVKAAALNLIRQKTMDKAKLLGLLGPDTKVNINIAVVEGALTQIFAILKQEVPQTMLSRVQERIKQEVRTGVEV